MKKNKHKTTNKQRKAAFVKACIKFHERSINEGRNKQIYRRAMRAAKKKS